MRSKLQTRKQGPTNSRDSSNSTRYQSVTKAAIVRHTGKVLYQSSRYKLHSLKAFKDMQASKGTTRRTRAQHTGTRPKALIKQKNIVTVSPIDLGVSRLPAEGEAQAVPLVAQVHPGTQSS